MDDDRRRLWQQRAIAACIAGMLPGCGQTAPSDTGGLCGVRQFEQTTLVGPSLDRLDLAFVIDQRPC